MNRSKNGPVTHGWVGGGGTSPPPKKSGGARGGLPRRNYPGAGSPDPDIVHRVPLPGRVRPHLPFGKHLPAQFPVSRQYAPLRQTPANRKCMTPPGLHNRNASGRNSVPARGRFMTIRSNFHGRTAESRRASARTGSTFCRPVQPDRFSSISSTAWGLRSAATTSAAFAASVIANGPTPANISRITSPSCNWSRIRWRSVESRAEK